MYVMPRFVLLLSIFVSSVLVLEAQDSKYALPSVAAEKGLPGEGALRRYTGYVNTWARVRKQWSTQIEQDQGAVVFLGDSITQGWGPKFRGHFAGVKLANRGIGGDTTRGMLIRLRQDVLTLNPKAVVILMGTNDIEIGLSPELIARNFTKIIKSLQEHNPTMPIILCRMFPSSATKNRPTEKIQKVNELYENVVRNDTQITVVDTFTLFDDGNGNALPLYFPDLLHLNTAGYSKWASALNPILATLGFLETGPDEFELEEGFRSLFNGRDLTGWGFRPTAPRNPPKNPRPGAPVFVQIKQAEDFKGKVQSSDQRYRAVNGRLVVTTPAEVGISRHP
jgi:lysophospholipase L1-like esterase